MTNSADILSTLLIIMVGIMVCLLIVLIIVYVNMKRKEKQRNIKKQEELGNTENKIVKNKQFTVNSIFNFMEFDKIEDNMIIQKNGNKYLMVMECQGINYDLMSAQEKISVEEGFVQFLNTLSSPVQIYTQTRTINLEESVRNYKEQVNQIESAYHKQQIKYNQLLKSDNVSKEELKKVEYELIKEKNLYEYGKDIIYNTEKMSLNKNILNKKYYIIISYYPSDLGQNNFDKEEIKDLAFSDLYTKAQSIIRTLSISGVIGKVMSSIELIDLLYIAYNRDDAEIFGIDKAIKARYDELYSTAPDYMENKIKLLDEELDKKAFEKASKKVNEVLSEKEKQYNEKKNNAQDIIDNLAQLIIDENIDNIGNEVATEAKNKITAEKKRKESTENVEKETKNRRRVSSSTK